MRGRSESETLQRVSNRDQDLSQRLLDAAGLNDDSIPWAAKLTAILTRPTGTTASGYPYLQQRAWEMFRDGVPQLFSLGRQTLSAVARVRAAIDEIEATDEERESVRRACKVARQVVLTAAVTAPPNLWLLHHVLSFFDELGLLSRLAMGDAIYPDECLVTYEGEVHQLRRAELEADLSFLHSLGIVEQYDESFRIAGHRRVRRLVEGVASLPRPGADPTPLWGRLFGGQELESDEQERLLGLCLPAPMRRDSAQNHWVPTLEEVELGYRLVPIVLGLRAADRTEELVRDLELRGSSLSTEHPLCASGALEVLTAAGWVERRGERYRITRMGARGFARGPGPFGIIQTYHAYMTQGRDVLLRGRGDVWVTRGENVGASQDANRKTFLRANDALDRFCAATGFSYDVFIEHAVGRGEATRQRFERDGEENIRYFGADLEDAAIDAAEREREAGRLPENMIFVRGADIGAPEVLLEALREAGVDPRGAVMLVGNGFHEVRDQRDDKMVSVFEGYCQAGIVLLFTEESALSIDDLRATAWNTYHAGFRYVHEKSGQALRPAEPRPAARLGPPLLAAWSECAQRAGYVRADAFCSRTRRIHPYTPRSGSNPAISVSHFFVPSALAEQLGLT